MQIKTYRAKSMREALALVRDELGPSASILHTREAPRGAIARLLRPVEVEVSATADEVPHLPTDAAPGFQSPATHFDPEIPAAAEEPLNDSLTVVRDELLQRDVSESAANGLLRTLRNHLAPSELADPRVVGASLMSASAQRLPIAGPIELTESGARVVALIGPTGVGKTTTLAKLAAGFRINHGARVGVITVDTYRMGAVDQLGSYAELIGVPMEVVSNAQEMAEAKAKLADLDLILIDTAGHAPRDAERLHALQSVLREAAPHETHLVLSANANSRSLAEAVKRFGAVGADKLLITKFDEAASCGHLLGLIQEAGLSIRYLTDGQTVPDDIEAADPYELARRLLGRASA